MVRMSTYIPLSHGLGLFRAEAEIGFRVCTASASDPKHESEHNREREREKELEEMQEGVEGTGGWRRRVRSLCT